MIASGEVKRSSDSTRWPLRNCEQGRISILSARGAVPLSSPFSSSSTRTSSRLPQLPLSVQTSPRQYGWILSAFLAPKPDCSKRWERSTRRLAARSLQVLMQQFHNVRVHYHVGEALSICFRIETPPWTCRKSWSSNTVTPGCFSRNWSGCFFPLELLLLFFITVHRLSSKDDHW